MRTAHFTPRPPALVAAGLIALLAVAGCSGSASDSGATSDRAASPAAGGPPQAEAPAADSGAKRGSVSGVPVAVPKRAPTDNRSIVYTGEITVESSDVDRAAAQASTVATGAGGVVAGDNRHADGRNSTADLVLRVPSAAFRDTVNKLADLGEEQSRALRTDDVTETIVDLDSRIASQKASVDRTRALLSRAERIGDIVTIEGELARREADLGSLQAQKRSLADKVTLSTITLHLIGPKAAPNNEEATGFLAGLSSGWDAFVTTANALLTAFGAMLPFLIAIGVPVGLLVWYLRRRRPRPVAPAAAPQPEG